MLTGWYDPATLHMKTSKRIAKACSKLKQLSSKNAAKSDVVSMILLQILLIIEFRTVMGSSCAPATSCPMRLLATFCGVMSG